LELPRQLLQK